MPEPKSSQRETGQLPLADKMAVERTHLSNERTLLSYLRTGLTLLGAGITIIRIDIFDKVYELGWVCVLSAPLILGFGIGRFLYNRRRIKKYFR